MECGVRSRKQRNKNQLAVSNQIVLFVLEKKLLN